MREEAALQSEKAGGTQVIFEGTVDKQEVGHGPIGAPQGALSMTTSGQHRVVTIRVSRAYSGHAEGVITGAHRDGYWGLWVRL
jgi:hypothetical protein